MGSRPRMGPETRGSHGFREGGGVPPASLRAGDFSQAGVTIYDPATRRIGPSGLVIADPLAGNQIPQSRMNASTVAVQALVPLPNFGAPGALSRNFFYAPARSSQTDQGDIRIDQNISANDNAFARFSVSDTSTPGVGSFPGFIGGGSDSIDNSQQGVVSEIHIFTPALVNEFRFGYIRHNGSSFGNTGEGRAYAAAHNLATLPSPLPGFPSFSFIYAGTVSGSAEFSGWGGGDPNLNGVTGDLNDDGTFDIDVSLPDGTVSNITVNIVDLDGNIVGSGSGQVGS